MQHPGCGIINILEKYRHGYTITALSIMPLWAKWIWQYIAKIYDSVMKFPILSMPGWNSIYINLRPKFNRFDCSKFIFESSTTLSSTLNFIFQVRWRNPPTGPGLPVHRQARRGLPGRLDPRQRHHHPQPQGQDQVLQEPRRQGRRRTLIRRRGRFPDCLSHATAVGGIMQDI